MSKNVLLTCTLIWRYFYRFCKLSDSWLRKNEVLQRTHFRTFNLIFLAGGIVIRDDLNIGAQNRSVNLNPLQGYFLLFVALPVWQTYKLHWSRTGHLLVKHKLLIPSRDRYLVIIRPLSRELKGSSFPLSQDFFFFFYVFSKSYSRAERQTSLSW